jgi:phospholipid/cholesterol/gamma-HCH transport system substrate-binding protein
MQKQAPSIGKILVAAGFALSCFGLLLFLWITFGGPTPLKPKSYRFTADFPEAITLALEADVRIGGVSVGKVKELDLPPEGNATRATIEVEPEFAPIAEDARAILRAKTLLGETYIELTSGSDTDDRGAPISLGAQGGATDAEIAEVEPIPEDGHLANAQVRNAVQIDEIFNALDEETRESFQRWQANAALAIRDRGLDLNDSFGNLGPFIFDASRVLEILRRQRVALKGLVRDTGEVFEALTERDQELAGVIVGSNNTFDALAQEERALAETFQIFPTFQRESRLTFERLDDFQANTRPLVQDLIPVARDLTPTLRNVRRLAPPLERLFRDLKPLIRASEKGLPALRRFLDGLAPVLDALDPFLANLNPVVRYLGFFRQNVTDFLAGPPAALAGTLEPRDGQSSPPHVLRQLSYLSAESTAVFSERRNTNRGNAYTQPGLTGFGYTGPPAARGGIFPNFDCKNTDFDNSQDQDGDPDEDPVRSGDARVGPGFAPCFTTPDYSAVFGADRAPNLFTDP